MRPLGCEALEHLQTLLNRCKGQEVEVEVGRDPSVYPHASDARAREGVGGGASVLDSRGSSALDSSIDTQQLLLLHPHRQQQRRQQQQQQAYSTPPPPHSLSLSPDVRGRVRAWLLQLQDAEEVDEAADAPDSAAGTALYVCPHTTIYCWRRRSMRQAQPTHQILLQVLQVRLYTCVLILLHTTDTCVRHTRFYVCVRKLRTTFCSGRTTFCSGVRGHAGKRAGRRR